jgi:SAM-dependent methyltransferase
MLGARVVSLDLSLSSVKMAHSLLDKAFDGSVVQADIFHLPLRHDVFDCSIALGVLHHTPNTRTALGFVSEVTKAGGVLVLHVYEKQNPCRTLLTNLLRWIIQRYPEIIQYRLIERYLVCDSRASGLKRRLYAFIGLFIMIAADPVGGFDAYSPRYNNVQSLPELLSWLRQAKFAGVEILSERKNLRFHDRLLRGDYGGAIYAKSHKAGSRVTR